MIITRIDLSRLSGAALLALLLWLLLPAVPHAQFERPEAPFGDKVSERIPSYHRAAPTIAIAGPLGRLGIIEAKAVGLGPPCCFAFAFGCGELLFRCFAFERSVGPLSNAQIPRAEATIQVEFSSIVLAPGGPSTLEPPARGERLGGRSVRPGGSCSSPPR